MKGTAKDGDVGRDSGIFFCSFVTDSESKYMYTRIKTTKTQIVSLSVIKMLEKYINLWYYVSLGIGEHSPNRLSP